MKIYYIAVPGGSPVGPLDEEVIKKGVEDGTYKIDSLVFCEGMADWEPPVMPERWKRGREFVPKLKIEPIVGSWAKMACNLGKNSAF